MKSLQVSAIFPNVSKLGINWGPSRYHLDSHALCDGKRVHASPHAAL